MTKSVSFVAVPGIPLIKPGDPLASILVDALKVARLSLTSGDVVVVADFEPSPRARDYAGQTGKDPRFVEVVLSESSDVIRAAPNVLIVAHRLGFIMANAGIDQSNIEHANGAERVLLLPQNPDAAAASLKAAIDTAFGVTCGVIV